MPVGRRESGGEGAGGDAGLFAREKHIFGEVFASGKRALSQAVRAGPAWGAGRSMPAAAGWWTVRGACGAWVGLGCIIFWGSVECVLHDDGEAEAVAVGRQG